MKAANENKRTNDKNTLIKILILTIVLTSVISVFFINTKKPVKTQDDDYIILYSVLSDECIVDGISGEAKNITIPSEIDGNKITKIGVEAFKDTNVETVAIENGILKISSKAFYGCKNLKSVSLPESIIEIGPSVFKDCVLLSEINLPNSIEYIGNSTFENCLKLNNVDLPNNIIEISDSLFANSGLKNINFPSSVTVIRGHAFEGCCNLNNAVIPANIVLVAEDAFSVNTTLTIYNDDVKAFLSQYNFTIK